MIKEKYNNVGTIMQCLKKQAECSMRDLELELAYSPNTVSGMIKGFNYDLTHYVRTTRYLLSLRGWEIDLSEVQEMLQAAFDGGVPFVVGVMDKAESEVTEFRYVVMKDIKRK